MVEATDGTLMAIERLSHLAIDRDYSADIRKEALRSLANYLPHPKAAQVIGQIATDRDYSEDVRLVAIQCLGRR